MNGDKYCPFVMGASGRVACTRECALCVEDGCVFVMLAFKMTELVALQEAMAEQ
jgi:hypothetical protein